MEPWIEQTLERSETERWNKSPPMLSILSPTFELEQIRQEINSKCMSSDSSVEAFEDRMNDSTSKTEIADRTIDEENKPSKIVVVGSNSGYYQESTGPEMENANRVRESDGYETPCQGGFRICLDCLFKLAAYVCFFVFLFCCIILFINLR